MARRMQGNWFHVELRRISSGKSYMQPLCFRCGARGDRMYRKQVERMIFVGVEPDQYPINQWLDNHYCLD